MHLADSGEKILRGDQGEALCTANQVLVRFG